jgi:hypothetical protein
MPDFAYLFRYTRSCLGVLFETPSLTTLGTAIRCLHSLPCFRTLVNVGLRHNLDTGSKSWYSGAGAAFRKDASGVFGRGCGSNDLNIPPPGDNNPVNGPYVV